MPTAIDYANLEPHPIADELPEMLPDEYAALVQDIKKNNLKERIVVFEDMILDGRHRYQALKDLGRTLNEDLFEDYDLAEGDPAKYAITRNIVRRHLTPGQRAFVGLNLLKRVGGIPQGKRKKNGNGDGMKLADAAKAAGTSPRRIQEVAKLERESPELAQEVRSGKKRLEPAVKEASARQIAPDYDKSMKRLKNVLGEEFVDQLSNGGIKMTAADVVEFATLDEDRMIRLAPVLEAGEQWKYAKSYENMEILPGTKLRQLWNLCLMRGGRLEDTQFGYKTVVTKLKTKKQSS